MELTVLGACGTYPGPGGACSGYLLRHEGFTLWIDAGHGTLSNLQRHVPASEVDAVFISHAHPDHFVDLYPFFYALTCRPDCSGTVPVYGPAPAQERIGLMLSKKDGKEIFSRVLPWQRFAAGEVVEAGPLSLRAFGSAHSTENLTLRVEAGGKTLCYSGDTGPNPDLERAAAGADLFLCEASWLEDDHTIPDPIHLRAREAGEAATRARVGRLVLCHIWPHNDLQVSRAQAAAAFGGQLDLADTGDRWTI